MDKGLIPRGATRTEFWKFLLWLLPWVLLAAWGLAAARDLFAEGLYHTNMDNRFAFGLWIILDLTIIALGAGVSVQEVNRMLKQFDQVSTMMRKMQKGGMAKMMRSMKGMMPGR